MKKILALLISAILTVSICACSGNTAQQDKTAFKTIAAPEYPKMVPEEEAAYISKERADEAFVQSLNAFSFAALSKITGGQKVNSVCSPLSLFMALSLAVSGAAGETEKEMLQTLQLTGKTKDYLSRQSKTLFEQLYCDNAIGKLMIANSVWINSAVAVKEDYANNAAKNFYASFFSADFTEPATADKMGEWVAQNTDNVLQPEFGLSPQDIFALINAVCLKDECWDKFDEKLTKNGVFHRADGTEVNCDYMHSELAGHGACVGPGYKSSWVSLKNTGAMWFVLPDENSSPEALLADPQKLKAAFGENNRNNADVIFSIPKFSFGNSYDLIPALRSLGMKAAFENADFSGIANEIQSISKVQQDAHIAIDEKGVEAAAFTQITQTALEMPEDETVEIKLNRPFIFGITSAWDGALIFAGTVYDPSVKN